MAPTPRELVLAVSPKAEMRVGAVADQPFGYDRGEASAPADLLRQGASYMPRQHGPIAGAHRILWGERDLDLPRRVLGVHLLHPNARALQVVYQVEEVISHVAEGGGPVAGATVDELHVSVPVLA